MGAQKENVSPQFKVNKNVIGPQSLILGLFPINQPTCNNSQKELHIANKLFITKNMALIVHVFCKQALFCHPTFLGTSLEMGDISVVNSSAPQLFNPKFLHLWLFAIWKTWVFVLHKLRMREKTLYFALKKCLVLSLGTLIIFHLIGNPIFLV